MRKVKCSDTLQRQILPVTKRSSAVSIFPHRNEHISDTKVSSDVLTIIVYPASKATQGIHQLDLAHIDQFFQHLSTE